MSKTVIKIENPALPAGRLSKQYRLGVPIAPDIYRDARGSSTLLIGQANKMHLKPEI